MQLEYDFGKMNIASVIHVAKRKLNTLPDKWALLSETKKGKQHGGV